MYHLVFPAKYRRTVLDKTVEHKLRDICLDIEQCYEVKFLEIVTDENHVHLLVQSVSMYSVKKIAELIKSLTAREIFRCCPEMKKKLWGGEF